MEKLIVFNCILLYVYCVKMEKKMSKIVTLRLDEEVYKLFQGMANNDNRALSNFITTAALRYIEENEYVEDYEMEELQHNDELNESIKRGLRDEKNREGRFV